LVLTRLGAMLCTWVQGSEIDVMVVLFL
jgi:hypothetical protein